MVDWLYIGLRLGIIVSNPRGDHTAERAHIPICPLGLYLDRPITSKDFDTILGGMGLDVDVAHATEEDVGVIAICSIPPEVGGGGRHPPGHLRG